MTSRPPPSRSSGLTLVELIITMTVGAIMILTVMPLFTVTSRGYTSLEVSTVLSAGTQEAMAKIQNRLAENKRLFGRDSAATFLTRVTPNLSASVLSGSQLPAIDPNASLSPSAAAFVSTDTGNCLLFAGVDQSVVATGVKNAGNKSVDVRVDVFVFSYYYLSPNTKQRIGPSPSLELWEWHSVPYLDYQNLIAVSDATLQHNTIVWLVGKGYTYAFDSASTNVSAAFYNLLGVSPWLQVQASHNIIRSKSKKMISLIRGMSTGSYTYSVSPNTGGSFTHRHVVPTYATADAPYPTGTFPSGFETMIVGPAGNRRIFARIVMAARGNFKGYMSYEQVILVAARDLW